MFLPFLNWANFKRLNACVISFVIVAFSSILHAQTSPYKFDISLTTDGDVADFKISQNATSNYIVYLADQNNNGVDELFSVPSDASGNPIQPVLPIKLNGALTPQGNVTETFHISPDGNHVVYLADQNDDQVFELFSVPIDGSSPSVRLNGNLATDGRVFPKFKISPDSQYVVYQADQNVKNKIELFSVKIDGSSPNVRLNSNLATGGDVLPDFKISPNSAHVVYLADQNRNGVNELFSVDIAGNTTPSLLNSPITGGLDVFDFFEISPNSQQVAYIGDLINNDIYALFTSTIIDGGASMRMVSADLTAGGDVLDFKYSPDGKFVIYLADGETDEKEELFSTDMTKVINGNFLTTKLNSNLIVDGDVYSDYQIDSASSTVIYKADQNTNSQTELYSVDIAGGIPVRLNRNLPANGDVSTYAISADDQWVVYRADQRTDNRDELFSVPIRGGSSLRLNNDLISNGNVSFRFIISPDSSQVLYSADQNSNGRTEVFRVPIRATSFAERLNSDLPSLGNISRFDVTPDGLRVIYMGDQTTNDVIELYSISIDSALEPKPVEDFCLPIVAKNGSVALICL